jgi:hypothetical protein
MNVGSVAAGAGIDCAAEAPIGRLRAALNFTVRRRKRTTLQRCCTSEAQ